MNNLRDSIIHRTSALLIFLVSICLVPLESVFAEPYLAVRSGLKCSACHSNPSGGGKRNQTGQLYGQTTLPSRPATATTDYNLNEYFDVGANFRFSLSSFDTPDGDDTLAFETERSNIYLESTLIRERLSLYLDQQVAPTSTNREMWALLYDSSHRFYAKAGKFFLPFGWRLEDNSSYVRSTSGLNFLTPDNGIEVGFETLQWSAQIALTNGTSGGEETNRAKRLSASAVYVRPRWRIGSSVSYNDGENDDRLLYALHAGAQIAGSELLFELDLIRDSSDNFAEGDRDLVATLIEVNRQVSRGSNVKLTYEFLDPDLDVDEDHHDRVSLVWELTPLPMLQLRLGTRQSEGIPQSSVQNTDLYFMQLHVWY